MSPVVLAALESWSFEPRLALALALAALLYVRGWRRVRRQMPERFPAWRLIAFLSGLALLYAAVASPLDAFAGLLLQVHMAQHLLLMTVVPPLLLAGAPAVPLLRGLPVAVARRGLGPFLAAPELRRLGGFLSHPVVGFLAMSVATWLWHAPGPYQLALGSPFWHQVEHLCFLAGGLLFWWPVLLPWPSRRRWPEWTTPLYLLLADVQNTALAAIFVFSERVIYPIYAGVPRLGGATALDDQVTAGVLMWVPMSLAYLVPAAVITVRLLSPRGMVPREAASSAPLAVISVRRLSPRGMVPREAVSPASLAAIVLAEEPPRGPRAAGFDLLALPRLGPMLRSVATRRVLQVSMFALAAAVVADGLLGPQMSPMNLAGVLPWTYGRGSTVVALLAAGNLFCMACPFTLARDLARRLGFAEWTWPRRLRSKWLAVALLVGFFWAYEVLGLWDDPRATALLVVAYFGAALAVDTLFRGAAFCKWVCPIGQFQFVHSLASPLEVQARDSSVCAACTTHDCLRGNDRGRGCELELFLPRKAGSLDCTTCLDCVRACPHDNVGLVAALPGRELWRDPERSSLGRLSRRLDVAVLALVLVAAAVVTAAAMVEPVVRWQEALAVWFGVGERVVVSVMLVATVAVVPIIVIGGVGVVSRGLAGGDVVPRGMTGGEVSARELFCRFSLALVPLGLATWAAHFVFHLLAGWSSALPVVRRAAADVGLGILGRPDWSMPPPLLSPDALLWLEILLLDAGLLLTLYSGWRVARSYPRTSLAALLVPWTLVAVSLWAAGVWVFLQPMEMRGLMVH